MQFIAYNGRKALTIEDTKVHKGLLEQLREFVGLIYRYIWRGFTEGVRGEAVGYAAGPEVGVASGDYVYGGVADHQRFFGASFGVVQDGLRAFRVGLFGGEAVATVDVEEELGEAEGFHDRAGGNYGFVREHGHLTGHAVGITNCAEHFFDAVVYVGVIELVNTVVAEEVLQAFFYYGFIPGIAEGATHEGRSAVAYVGGNHVAGKRGAAKVLEHGIYRVDEVEARVDEGSVEVEDEELDLVGIEFAVEFDHVVSG